MTRLLQLPPGVSFMYTHTSLLLSSRIRQLGLLILACCCACTQPEAMTDEDTFSRNVRPTEAQSPEQEMAGFTLPPGFEIQLFASEPDIGKPLNMAFDARGRMWLTQSFDYPFADTTGASKDRISILEDTDADGQADKFTVFADSLNIPIGIVAVNDGVIAYSIPHIYHFIDKDGDDKVDERKVLLSSFGYDDTHGMINNLIRSWDGWIHAGHGFSNTSTVAGTDGDTIVMTSGNTFRFRPDGSRVEFTTTGRVNPFGYAYDEMGYTYSVDCHTSPIYQLIRGADYPHFGKQPTGIGFGPAIMEHEYGATALAGLEYCLGAQFPPEYQESFYMGDVVKSRVYRSSMVQHDGTTPSIKQDPDFIVSEDLWFRPVDVKMGPDGALYVADFYNRIIGHYEVPLSHTGRDRHRGRIWKITYKGQTTKALDLTTASLDELVQELDHKNLPFRMSISDQLVDRFGQEAVLPVNKLLDSPKTEFTSYVQGLWILFRLDALSDQQLVKAAKNPDPRIKIHALRILFEYEKLNETLLQVANEALLSPNPHIQRQATMVLARNPHIEQIAPLMRLRHAVSEENDSHFFYALRQSLRDHLRNEKVKDWVLEKTWNEQDAHVWADLMMGVDDIDAARFLTRHLQQYQVPDKQLIAYARHAARYLPPSDLDQLIGISQERTGEDEDLAYSLYKGIQEGLAQGGISMSSTGKAWGISLASSFLPNPEIVRDPWKIQPNAYRPYAKNPWRIIETKIGKDSLEVIGLTSGPVGDAGYDLSTAFSPSFTLPTTLRFLLFGSKQAPAQNETPSPPLNRIELRLVEDDSLISSKDIDEWEMVEKVSWHSKSHLGKEAYLAIIDGSGNRGEHIGIGNLSPQFVSLPDISPAKVAERQIFAAQIASTYQADPLKPALETLLLSESEDVYARVAAAEALLGLEPGKSLPILEKLLQKEQPPPLLKEKLSFALSEHATPRAMAMVRDVIGDLSYNAQKNIALNLTNSSAGIELLLEAAGEMNLPPRILREREIQDRLLSQMKPQQQKKFETLTANIKPPGEGIQALIKDRLLNFRNVNPSVENGKQVFTQNCSPCHQIKHQGGNIGPQLDGIGNWGPQALTEKILDPNRNISKAFVNYTLTTTDGKVRTGLFRREDGELLVFADVAGLEFTIPQNEIKEQKVSPFTLMPDHFGQIIPETDYYDLLKFLLQEN